jgi:hypothetical protein
VSLDRESSVRFAALPCRGGSLRTPNLEPGTWNLEPGTWNSFYCNLSASMATLSA